MVAQTESRLETPLGRVCSPSAPTPVFNKEDGMSKRRRSRTRGLRRVNPYAAGIDVGSASHWVAIDPSLTDQPVREFAAYTADLHAMADWLIEHGVTTVAMEATGVYWVAAFEVLRDRGLEVCLVDARATKQVSGRKSDISDCQWTQELHSYGLLKQAFLPTAEIATLRSYMRQRDRWVADAGRAIQHMQQALELMNVKLTEVVNDITGGTGRAIIDAILAGERDPQVLSKHRHPRCARSQEEIARALQGNWKEEHLFALEQARHHLGYLEERITACDERIDAVMGACATSSEEPPGGGKLDRAPHPFAFDARGHCFRLAGVDLTTIDGVGVNTVLTVLSEVGVDMTPWRSERAFGSWLGIAPNPRRSGGRLLSSHTRPNAQRAATALRLAAWSLSSSKSALGAFYRRLRARIGAPKAITAAAYKIAKLIYRMLKTRRPYQDLGQAAYDERFRARRLKSLTRMARDLGFHLVASEAS
jgi:transposase